MNNKSKKKDTAARGGLKTSSLIEDALSNSERRFRELFNNMDTCVAIYEAKNDGSDFIFKDFNKAAERVEKIKKETLIGKSVLEIFPGVKEFGLFEVFQRVWKTGKPQEHPVALYKDKRITGWKENYVYKLPSGEIVAIYSDATARKQIEESLKQSYSLLSATLESTADGILVVDVHGRVSSFNQKFLELWRIPKTIVDRLDDQQLLKFVLDQLEDPAAFLARVQELYLFPQDSSWEELKFRDGRVFERYSQPQRLGDAVVGRVWSFRDITERKKAEDALQRLEQEKNMVLDTVSELIVYQDTQNTILWANKAAAESVGLTADQIIGKKCYEVWHNRSVPCLLCAVRDCIRTGLAESSENQTSDGRYWKVNAQPLKDNKGVVTGVIETTIDITRQKKIEDELRRDKKNIEKQLEDSRRLADIGTLAATVAHELRNPLGVINTAIYNLRMKIGDNENLIKHIKNIEKKIAESDQIIENLLSYSRIKTPNYTKMNVSSVLDDCLAFCRNKYTGYDVEVKIIYGNCPKDLLIDADPVHITALFSNILDNAYQAFGDKKGRIDISVDCDKKKDMFNIVFTDNGCGMDDYELDKAFEPFFTTRSRGMGLGLSVCQQVVNLHSGSINTKSKKDEGTSMYVSLPLIAQP
ncbi:MAG: PAS domain-containing protein [Candidatus Omnitrophota bacterium]|nr:PAS domain-containing protein [Candidatus Omnitrophota bacterium]